MVSGVKAGPAGAAAGRRCAAALKPEGRPRTLKRRVPPPGTRQPPRDERRSRLLLLVLGRAAAGRAHAASRPASSQATGDIMPSLAAGGISRGRWPGPHLRAGRRRSSAVPRPAAVAPRAAGPRSAGQCPAERRRCQRGDRGREELTRRGAQPGAEPQRAELGVGQQRIGDLPGTVDAGHGPLPVPGAAVSRPLPGEPLQIGCWLVFLTLTSIELMGSSSRMRGSAETKTWLAWARQRSYASRLRLSI